ncbi:DUF4381 domain-containing protein [Litoribrevibacter euphylliae]|uniref:DUF4381 domain-containing protein n=1 Tax=Litoribrevibacter euphylliae TaxID=1834034 RepID=A0ABV7HHM3_9GAMM
MSSLASMPQGFNTAQPGTPDLTEVFGEIIESPAIDSSPFVWPPALGWWLIAACLLVAIFFVAKKTKQVLRKRAEYHYLSSAIDSLTVPSDSAPETDKTEFIKQLNRALKAIAIEKYGHSQVAPLSGESWLTFLDRSGNCNHFKNGAGKVFGQGLYQKERPKSPDLTHLKEVCILWCKEVCQ